MENANYNFKRFIPRNSKKKYCGMSKGKRHLHITTQFMEKLKSNRIAVYFDINNLSILVRPAKDEE